MRKQTTSEESSATISFSSTVSQLAPSLYSLPPPKLSSSPSRPTTYIA